MRLVCPNCEAKYEVPDDAIPDTGRDVQCANCGHAWYQMRHRAAAPVAEPAAAPEPVVEAAPSPTPEPEVAASVTEPEPAGEPPVAETEPATEETAVVAEPAVDVAAVVEPEVEPATEPAAEPQASDAVEAAADAPEDAEPAVVPAAANGASAYGVDDSVLAILREEAEREANARRAEARPLESQTDLGIEAVPPAKPAVVAPVDTDAKPSARRDLLPDVEEINSTLRPSEQPMDDPATGAADAGVVPPARRGFQSGFLTVMTVAIIGASVYIAAPSLSAAIPALADPLNGYVAFVDGFRLQLDGLMRSATVAINGS